MKTAAQTTFPERVGRTLGRLWRGCVRLDRRAMQGLVAKGWKPGVAKSALLLVKIAAFAVLLYAAFWIALLLAFALAAAWMVRNDDGSYDQAQEPEWRYGPAGYGLYTSNEQRIDPHDPEDDQS